MSVLSDRWIKKLAIENEMIKPFIGEQKADGNISYGLSSFGYDAEFLMNSKFLQMLTQR